MGTEGRKRIENQFSAFDPQDRNTHMELHGEDPRPLREIKEHLRLVPLFPQPQPKETTSLRSSPEAPAASYNMVKAME